MDLVHHGLYLILRPVLFIKAVASLIRPVEEIDYDYIKMYSQLLILTYYTQHFVGCTVTQLALPEAKVIG